MIGATSGMSKDEARAKMDVAYMDALESTDSESDAEEEELEGGGDGVGVSGDAGARGGQAGEAINGEEDEEEEDDVYVLNSEDTSGEAMEVRADVLVEVLDVDAPVARSLLLQVMPSLAGNKKQRKNRRQHNRQLAEAAIMAGQVSKQRTRVHEATPACR